MPYYAKIEKNKVVDIQNISQYELNQLPGEWFETSYLAIGGKFYDPETRLEIVTDQIPLRKNFPLIGFTYNRVLDAFIPFKDHKTWILNTETCLWEPPFDKPDNKNLYFWNDEIDNWSLWVIGGNNV